MSRHPTMTDPASEKLTEELKLRLGVSTFVLLSRLANAADRPLTEYIRSVVMDHAYGHGRKVLDSHDADEVHAGPVRMRA